ncbi:MAG TPA: hypothetical protein PK014_13470 [Thermoanaerobaculia bacterium]|nr:hypothetical protein [Thermoanaerobaculia bacterium]HUM31083.1 hypothetical protein [Thermoanaerobaculia bacterium]HXK69405.1 hypothetical protein [Thermoanaerobaculia bacterium]
MKQFMLGCLILMMCSVGFGQASSWWRIPAVGSGPGAYGSYWLSDIYLFNPNLYPISVNVYLIYTTGTYGPLTYTIPEWGSTTIKDVGGKFSLQGAAALQIQGQNDAVFNVMSRTYNRETNGDTTGQDIAGQDWCAGNSSGPSQMILFLGIQQNSGFRTNMGFMGGSNPVDLLVSVYDGNNQYVTGIPVHLDSWSGTSFSLAKYTSANISNGYAIASITSSASACVNGYASVVDNGTQDGTYIGGQILYAPMK